MFSEEYKRLAKLCADVTGNTQGVTAYIDMMKSLPRGELFVRGWREDLNRLKHYRWVRNRIAHDPGCTEDNMCNPLDSQWIANFYRRIMNQTDPLALYYKATRPTYTPVVYKSPETHITEKRVSKSGWVLGFALTALLFALLTIVTVLVIMIVQKHS